MKVKSESYLKSGSNELRVLEYKVKGQSFGINILKVSKIIMEMEKFTKVPDSNDSVTGIFDDRSSLVPTIDLAYFLGFSPEPITEGDTRKVVVTEFFGRTNGLLVDEINWIHHFVWEDLIDVGSVLGSIKCPHVTGIVRPDGGDHMVLMLDYESIILNLCPELELSGHIDSATVPRFDGSGMRALIAEDSPAVAAMLEVELNESGFEVVTVGDGHSAIEIINAQPDFDLVISDVEMPRMDGLALLVAIREKYGKKIAVLIYSSIGDAGMKKRAEFLEADGHITKLNLDELRTAITEILSNRKEKKPKKLKVKVEVEEEAAL